MTQDNEGFSFYLSDEDTKFLMDLGKEMLNQTRHKGAATIHWLDSSEDVARKGK